MIIFRETAVVSKLPCMRIFSIDGKSVGMYFQVQKMWNAILEFVYCELKVWMKSIEYSENLLCIIGLHQQKSVVHVSRVKLHQAFLYQFTHYHFLELRHNNVDEDWSKTGSHTHSIYLFINGVVVAEFCL